MLQFGRIVVDEQSFGSWLPGGLGAQALTDAHGNVLLIGGTPGSMPGLYTVFKFSPNGVLLWTNQSVNFGTNNGSYHESALDRDGNLYLVGIARAPDRDDYDYVMLKYSADGQGIWTNCFDSGGSSDIARALAVGRDGAVYVTGSSARDFTTLKYADAIVYVPPVDFTGLDTITYVIADQFGNRATGSVEVLVAPGHFHLSPSATRMTVFGLQLRVEGVPLTNPVVLTVSPDLTSWQRIQTNAPSGNAVEFIDPNPLSRSRRFYGAIQER